MCSKPNIQASALYQRREAFFNGNTSSAPSPAARSMAQAPDAKSQLNGECHTASAKDFNRPQSPNGVSSAAAPTTAKKFNAINVKELHGTVGFANIPNQVFRKAVKQGFEFTLMVVGQSGLGKSTFVNSLFLTDFYNSKASQNRKMPSNGKTMQINECAVRLVENGVSLTLNLVDTPGFGDAVDNSQCWDPIIQFVDRKFFDYFSEETKIYRKDRIPDNRVHCCLYFIAPTGHGLKPLDIEFMKHLHDRVNIIPVIAKADTMTLEECAAFKKMVAKDITDNKIRIYEFPDVEDVEEVKDHKQYKNRVPFAVIGSNTVCDVGGGKKARCRKYPWGVVEVDNLEHNDFIALRNMIIRDPFTQMEEQRRECELHMKQEEAKREQIFQEKLAEKQDKLKQAEKEADRHVEQMRMALEQKRRELEQKRAVFMQDRLNFKQQYPEFQKYISSTSLSEKVKLKKKRSIFSRDTPN